jgi:hypothetical protein
VKRRMLLVFNGRTALEFLIYAGAFHMADVVFVKFREKDLFLL